MAVVYVREVFRGVGLRVSYTGAKMEAQVNRKFLIRVDNFSTPAAAICAAPGISVGAKHPAFPTWSAADFSVDCEDSTGLMWSLTVLYKSAIREVEVSGIPADEWAISNTTTLVPAITHFDNINDPASTKRIDNSAGTPLEGLKREVAEMSWKLTKAYPTAAALMAVVKAVNNTTNEKVWGGEVPGRWKCDFRGGSKRKIQSPNRTSAGDPAKENAGATGEVKEIEYWEGVFEFQKNDDGWDLQPWDQGYMQKVDTAGKPSQTGTSLQVIRGQDGRPVKEPWKLDGKGMAITSATADPVKLKFQIYKKADYAAKFGQPPA